MRKVGIYYAFWAHEWDVDFVPYIKKVGKLGFDQLELNGGTIVHMTAQQQRDLKSLADEHGLTLSYGIGLQKPFDVASLDASVRRRGIDFMKKMIDAVAIMGGGMIGGTIYGYWPSTLPEELDSKQPCWDQSIKSMKELASYAGERNVLLNVEVINRFEQFLINDSHEALAYVQEVDHPACRILLDTFHMNIEEDSFTEAIHRVGPYLAAFHLGETNRKTPGTGRMPWAEIKQALDDINFDGPMVMEPFVMKGGQIGRDIGVWRDIVKDPDLDTLAAEAASFVRNNLC
ncbi:sugar phosphate isomerase/epimerase family protein [Sphaerochaeta sp.]|uniref:D-psicose 3-epimerase n=1 Tax=Sphaerochaeta sp. TaxID=1972642 RepID=UPI003D10EB44